MEKFELFKQIKSSVTFLLNSFKGFKHLKLADCLNFEDFEFYILIAGLEKGLYFKFCLPSLNEVLKKEIFEKIKIDEKEKEIEDKIIEENELIIIQKFRKDYNLDEKDYSNENLIKTLRKYNYNFVDSFSSLFG